MSKESQTIVVIGQRRSGTSLVSGVLHKLGIPTTNTPEVVSRFNERGYFEDRDIIQISEKIAPYLGYQHFIYIQNSLTEQQITVTRKVFGSEIQKVINQKSKNKVWGFKDVYQVAFHEIYKPFIPNPVYIVILRNLESTIKSLMNWHTYLRHEVAANFVRAQNELTNKFIKQTKEPLIVLNYEDAVINPHRVVETIVGFLKNNDIYHFKPQDIKKAIAHIDLSIKHF